MAWTKADGRYLAALVAALAGVAYLAAANFGLVPGALPKARAVEPTRVQVPVVRTTSPPETPSLSLPFLFQPPPLPVVVQYTQPDPPRAPFPAPPPPVPQTPTQAPPQPAPDLTAVVEMLNDALDDALDDLPPLLPAVTGTLDGLLGLP